MDQKKTEPGSSYRNGIGQVVLYGEFTATDNRKVRYAVSLTELDLTVQKITSAPAGRSKVVFNLRDCVGCRAFKGEDNTDAGAYFSAYFYPFKRRWMSSGVSRQRVEQCFRVALVQDSRANLEEAQRWARAITEGSVHQRPQREGQRRSREDSAASFLGAVPWAAILLDSAPGMPVLSQQPGAACGTGPYLTNSGGDGNPVFRLRATVSEASALLATSSHTSRPDPQSSHTPVPENLCSVACERPLPSVLYSEVRRPCRVMVLLNPHSGKGQALSLFTGHVQRMLTEAGVPYTLVITGWRRVYMSGCGLKQPGPGASPLGRQHELQHCSGYLHSAESAGPPRHFPDKPHRHGNPHLC
ncbi:hypothetical protein JZ751_026762 [Albula glossodonta]|uniref:DAGKc domain-containing protein n=1 Tax=Albula glossodonta TaxID=121402 RepID=A0A8T2PKZ0_9TELE|nr:hypothetical protein JZ751_026762 [Albula glossodonta]